MALFDNCVFVYSCSSLSLSGCRVTSMFCIYPHTTTPCQCSVGKTNWSALYKKSLPGASHFEIKSMSLCSALVPGMGERAWECCTEERGTFSKCCDFHSQGITQSLLSIPLNQETTGRKGRRIRLAREQGERKSGLSNPDGVCRGTPSTVEMRPVCCAESGLNGVGARQFASLNPLHLHERSSSKLGGLVRV